ncbi:MAG: HEAT repeat domain-containing protein [Planctomycetes bacterium]|nr:HEAT repeat domain-containing protein [Planctomycetota bacterium]
MNDSDNQPQGNIDDDLPPDPLTGRRTTPSREPEAAPVAIKSTRPPWWLIAFTLLIPLSVFAIWYMNWMGRPLSPAAINENLGSSNDKEVAHALIQIAIQVQNNAEEREGSRLRLNSAYDAQRKDIDARLQGEQRNNARKTLEEQFKRSGANIDEQFNRFYREIETTFPRALDFVRNSGQRPAPLVEAACNALAAMKHSSQHSGAAQNELRKLLGHESKVVRRAAACNLTAWGDRSGREIILEMLDDPDPLARGNACLALARGGLATDAQRVKKLADSDPDPKVRDFAFHAYSALSGQVD